MKLRVIKSTDGQNIGSLVEFINKGEVLHLPTMEFLVTEFYQTGNDKFVLSNPNYLIECEETSWL